MDILSVKNRKEFRKWLSKNHDKEIECYVLLKRGKPVDDNIFYYIDAVEEALCFGWIDSTQKVIDGIRYQRFSPRKKNSHWSELNKARCKWLIKNNLMTKAGFNVLPDLNEEFEIDKDIVKLLEKDKDVWKNFNNFPELYRRIRISNIQGQKSSPCRTGIDLNAGITAAQGTGFSRLCNIW